MAFPKNVFLDFALVLIACNLRDVLLISLALGHGPYFVIMNGGLCGCKNKQRSLNGK
jgi:hypothetical protein